MEGKEIESLLELGFISKKQNAVITGSTASGKTRLSKILKSLARDAGYKTVFFRIPDLFLGNRKDYVMRLMEEAHFVILDEFGYMPMTKQQSEDLFEFITEASQDKSVLINTIREFSDWEKLMPDPILGKTFIRICTENCVHIHLTGQENVPVKRLKRKERKSVDEQR